MILLVVGGELTIMSSCNSVQGLVLSPIGWRKFHQAETNNPRDFF